MFICDFCNRTSQPTATVNFITTKIKTHVYKYGNHGHDIAEEKKACRPCAVERNDFVPEVVGNVVDVQEDRPYEDDNENSYYMYDNV